jgi:hypothetical protein
MHIRKADTSIIHTLLVNKFFEHQNVVILAIKCYTRAALPVHYDSFAACAAILLFSIHISTLKYNLPASARSLFILEILLHRPLASQWLLEQLEWVQRET